MISQAADEQYQKKPYHHQHMTVHKFFPKATKVPFGLACGIHEFVWVVLLKWLHVIFPFFSFLFFSFFGGEWGGGVKL